MFHENNTTRGKKGEREDNSRDKGVGHQWLWPWHPLCGSPRRSQAAEAASTGRQPWRLTGRAPSTQRRPAMLCCQPSTDGREVGHLRSGASVSGPGLSGRCAGCRGYLESRLSLLTFLLEFLPTQEPSFQRAEKRSQRDPSTY